MKIISGGQSGVDRAALDAAIECGLVTGGWCPRNRRAEDGVIDVRYPLRETASEDYEERTLWNVRDSDATLIVRGPDTGGGTAFTIECAERLGKPYFIVQFDEDDAWRKALVWLHSNRIEVLNVAGPRESTVPGAYAAAKAILIKILATIQENGQTRQNSNVNPNKD